MGSHTLKANCLVLVLIALSNATFVKGDVYLNMPEEDWVDPGDMLRYDYSTKTTVPQKVIKKAQMTSEIQENSDDTKELTSVASPSCQQSEFHFYKRFIRSVLAHFMYELYLSNDMEEMQFDVLMKLTESELATLKSYVSPASKVAIQDVDQILTHLIKRVRLHQEAKEYVERVTWLERLLQQAQDHAGMIFSVMAGFFVIFTFRQLSPARAFVLGLVLLYVAGTVYEGINMYQKLEAEKLAERRKLATIPEQCNPESVNVFRRIGWSFQVNLLGMDDPCKKYYELLMVDTRFQINPLEVATSALGKVFKTMARFGGSALGLFYSKALGHFNFLEKILVVAVFTVVSVAAVMYMGPALVFSLPGLIRTARRVPFREMVENIPQGQHQQMQPSGSSLMQRTAPAIALAPCSRCGSHQPVLVENELPLPSSSRKITVTSGNKRISIEDVEPAAIEPPGGRVESCAVAGNSDYESSEENLPESSPTDGSW